MLFLEPLEFLHRTAFGSAAQRLSVSVSMVPPEAASSKAASSQATPMVARTSSFVQRCVDAPAPMVGLAALTSGVGDAALRVVVRAVAVVAASLAVVQRPAVCCAWQCLSSATPESLLVCLTETLALIRNHFCHAAGGHKINSYRRSLQCCELASLQHGPSAWTLQMRTT